jgi:hypothetical protein
MDIKKGVLVAALAASVQAQAYFVDTTDVGGLDTLLGTGVHGIDLPNASIESETDWVNSVLTGTEGTFHIREDPVTYFATTDVSNTVFAFNMLAPDDYFLVKNSQGYALYENNASLDWGVFDTSLLGSEFQLPDSSFSISHVTTFNGEATNNNVPEPASAALLGLGLLGLGWMRRKDLKPSV